MAAAILQRILWVFLVLVIGVLASIMNLPPAPQIKGAYIYFIEEDFQGRSGLDRILNDLDIDPNRHTNASDYAPPEGRPFREIEIPGMLGRRTMKPRVFIDPSREPALTLVLAMIDTPEARFSAILLGPEGEFLHRWPVLEPPVEQPTSPVTILHPDGIVALPDGSIIVASNVGGTVWRMDACGRYAWARSLVSHHSVALDGPEHVWTWDDWNAVKLEIDTGREVARLDHERVMAANPETDIFRIREVNGLGPSYWLHDPFHANDADPLPEDLAPAFPMFEAGDLAISYRSLNLLAVIDPETHAVKWWRQGIGRRLHDPDWMPDGRILFFDNNTNRGPSRVRAVDPATYAVEDLVEGEAHDLYTAWQGRQQRREDGSILVTSSFQGRGVEVTPDGRVTFEFLNDYSEGRVGLVSDVQALPLDHFDRMPLCESE